MQKSLQELLARAAPLQAPGVYDALSALMVQQAGFPCAYLSGASLSYTRLGRPDVGLITLSELVDALTRIRERVSLPLVVDADTGFGNHLNMQRSVRMLENAGASAIQVEDQQLPKRCGHMAGKTLATTEDMLTRLQAALDARRQNTLVVARTDAIAVEGIDAALERAGRYLEAGADLLFIEAPQSREELARIGREFGDKAPLVANMVEGGRTPPLSAAELGELGYALIIYPGALVRSFMFAARELLTCLAKEGATSALAGRMLDFDELNRTLGLEALQQLDRHYAGRGAGDA